MGLRKNISGLKKIFGSAKGLERRDKDAYSDQPDDAQLAVSLENLNLFRSAIGFETPGSIPFRSEVCNSHHFLFECYAYWCDWFKEKPRYHRKQWEFVFIAQALWERGFLHRGAKGLGFGVGREPLVATFAAQGCGIMATDMDLASAIKKGWVGSNEYANTLQDLNERNICDHGQFIQQVDIASVNMNHIPERLKEFDFCWSACCFEHLGNLAKGLEFVRNSLKTLRSGGLAVHTTEFNLSSNDQTVAEGDTVLYREKDIRQLIHQLIADGHDVEPLVIHKGSQPIDDHIDLPPYCSDAHVRLRLGDFAVTSVGIIIKKGDKSSPTTPHQ